MRNLRYYQERGLLPPPRREGRVARYSRDRPARLRVISGLLERGHTPNGVGELLTARGQGSGVAEVLGLQRVLTEAWSEEGSVTLTRDEPAALFGEEAAEKNIRRAAAPGRIGIEGGSVTHDSRRLLDGTLALVRAGGPLPAVLATGRRLQERMDETAGLIVDLVRCRVPCELARGPLPPAGTQRLPGSWGGCVRSRGTWRGRNPAGRWNSGCAQSPARCSAARGNATRGTGATRRTRTAHRTGAAPRPRTAPRTGPTDGTGRTGGKGTKGRTGRAGPTRRTGRAGRTRRAGRAGRDARGATTPFEGGFGGSASAGT